MSSLRAISLPTQRIEPMQAVPTEVYAPLPAHLDVPAWTRIVEESIRVTARLGFSPTPTILLVSALLLGSALSPR